MPRALLPAGRVWTARLLHVVADVRPGEVRTGLTLLASVFLLLTTNYLLKPARDGLLAISGVPGLTDLEVKAYSGFGQSLLLLAFVPLYGRLATRLPRAELVTRVTIFFIASFLVFWALQPGLAVTRVPFLGIGFYLWVGVFNVAVVAQFWALSADLYGEERGQRLFPLIAIGAAAGAAAGAWLARWLVPAVGTYGLILLAAGALGVSLALMRLAEARGAAGERRASTAPATRPSGAGTLQLVLRHRYLLATALVILILNWIKTNADNLLFSAVQEVLAREVEIRGLEGGEAVDRFVSDRTTAFYGDLFFWINAIALFLQALAASRILRWGGFAVLILVLPVLSLGAYSVLAAMPVLWLFRVVKIAEDSTNYSLNNTALQVLWLPTRREMKYRAKTAIDTVFVRIGDGLAALTAFAGIHLLVLPVSAFFVVNVVLAAIWVVLAVLISRDYRRLVRRIGRAARRRARPRAAG